jgi:hypothetical protein
LHAWSLTGTWTPAPTPTKVSRVDQVEKPEWAISERRPPSREKYEVIVGWT